MHRTTKATAAIKEEEEEEEEEEQKEQEEQEEEGESLDINMPGVFRKPAATVTVILFLPGLIKNVDND